MEIQVQVHDWLALPMQTRIKLREIFHIPRSKGSLVEGNVVKSDGTTHDDLKAITIEKMMAYIDLPALEGREPQDFVTLFNGVIEKIVDLDKELELAQEKPDPTMMLLEEWASTLTRMKVQADNLNLSDHFKTLISNFIPNAKVASAHSEPAKLAKQTRKGK